MLSSFVSVSVKEVLAPVNKVEMADKFGLSDLSFPWSLASCCHLYGVKMDYSDVDLMLK